MANTSTGSFGTTPNTKWTRRHLLVLTNVQLLLTVALDDQVDSPEDARIKWEKEGEVRVEGGGREGKGEEGEREGGREGEREGGREGGEGRGEGGRGGGR